MATRSGRLAGVVGALALMVSVVVTPGAAVAAPATGTAYVEGQTLYIVAGVGGASFMTVTPMSDNTIVVQDSARFTLNRHRSTGCLQTDAWSVTCLSVITGVDVQLGDGNDEFHSYTDRVVSAAWGGAGDDQLWGWFGVEHLVGGPGTDELYGLPGADRLWGDDGDDLVEGHEGADVLYGGTGTDSLNGGADNDYLYGEAGTDWLSGGAGNDYLVGGPGLGSVRGDDGNDDIIYKYVEGVVAGGDYWGGAGRDQISYFQLPVGVSVSLNNLADDVPRLPVTTVRHNVHDDIEIVHGTSYDDLIFGSEAANVLIGYRGDDVLSGRGGDDELMAVEGNNQLVFGGTGTDTCTGENLIVRDQCEFPR